MFQDSVKDLFFSNHLKRALFIAMLLGQEHGNLNIPEAAHF